MLSGALFKINPRYKNTSGRYPEVPTFGKGVPAFAIAFAIAQEGIPIVPTFGKGVQGGKAPLFKIRHPRHGKILEATFCKKIAVPSDFVFPTFLSFEARSSRVREPWA